MNEEVLRMREEMDAIDQRIAELVQQRIHMAQKILNYKKEMGLPSIDPEREKEIRERAGDGFVAQVINQIVEEGKKQFLGEKK